MLVSAFPRRSCPPTPNPTALRLKRYRTYAAPPMQRHARIHMAVVRPAVALGLRAERAAEAVLSAPASRKGDGSGVGVFEKDEESGMADVVSSDEKVEVDAAEKDGLLDTEGKILPALLALRVSMVERVGVADD